MTEPVEVRTTQGLVLAEPAAAVNESHNGFRAMGTLAFAMAYDELFLSQR